MVDWLSNSDNRESSSMCMPKIVRKGLGGSLSVNSMDKVNQSCVIGNCISENYSRIKVVYVYHLRETVVSMRSNTLPEERRFTKSVQKQTCIAQTRCIGPITKTLKTNLPLTGGKTVELIDWDHIVPREVYFPIFITIGVKQPLLGSSQIRWTHWLHTKNSQFFTLQKGKNEPCLKGLLFVAE